MSFLYILQGLPGSGKTTYAKELVQSEFQKGKIIVNVNRDDIRASHGFGVYSGDFEPVVTKIQHGMIRLALKSGYDVISSDTNLNPKFFKELVKIGEFFGARIEKASFHLRLEDLLHIDNIRTDHKVGEDVIRGMWNKYGFTNESFPHHLYEINSNSVSFNQYIPDETKPHAVIFDIDGTLASHEGVRSPYDYTKVFLDQPRQAVIEVLRMYHSYGYHIIIMSGRESSCREDTIRWLYFNVGDWIEEKPDEYSLFMRPAGDKRQDRLIKGELFDKYVRYNYDVEAVYDDRDSVVRLWRHELGLNCFQVNYGDF